MIIVRANARTTSFTIWLLTSFEEYILMDSIKHILDFILHLDKYITQIVAQYGVLTYGLIFLIIFLISSLSFGLGYLVNREFTHPPIIIEKSCNQEWEVKISIFSERLKIIAIRWASETTRRLSLKNARYWQIMWTECEVEQNLVPVLGHFYSLSGITIIIKEVKLAPK